MEQRDKRVEAGASIQEAYAGFEVGRPELFLHLTMAWIIFNVVHKSISVSDFGIVHVSLTEICTMLTEFSIDDPDTRIYYIQLLQAMDSKYVDYLVRLRK